MAPSIPDERYRLPATERAALRPEINADALEQLLGRLPAAARHMLVMLCRSDFGARELGDALRNAGSVEPFDDAPDQTHVLRPRFADPELAALWTAAVGSQAG